MQVPQKQFTTSPATVQKMHFLRLLSVIIVAPIATASTYVSKASCAGKTFTYKELAGYGIVAANFTDKYGDTLSMGSSIAIKKGSWKKIRGGKYKGTLYALPDRGWNTEGTTAYQPRIHIFSITFSPTTQSPSPPNLAFEYEDTILFSDPSGTPISGLDPTTVLKFRGYPDIPAATFTGNGFGGNGPGGTRVSIDPEGLVLDSRGGFWISDEYGPYIYHFTSKGRMNIAIRPTPAFIPLRNGTQSFASNNPPVYNPDQVPVPEIPTSGRSNNQGFEGLSYDPEKKALYTLLQSATIQDGGTAGTTRRHARLLKYDLSHRHGRAPRLVGEYVVRLPVFNDPTETKNPRTAAQSEILALGDGRFLLLARDSGFGRGQDETESVYRHIDVFSLASATNILGAYDGHNGSVSPAGVLKPDITAAETCSFLDINISSELAKFGLLNGGTDNDALGLLNEKWEGLALVPVEGHRGEYWLFASSDNDFITQEGYQNFGRDAFADSSGFNLLNQMLVFRVSIK